MRGTDQTTLARQLGVDKITVWRWFNDESKPNYSQLGGLADLLGVTVDQIMGRTEVAEPSASPDRRRLDLIALVLAADQAKIAQLATFLKAELSRDGFERAGGEGEEG